MSEDICGSTNTTSGEPCKFTPAESCPWHDSENPAEGRKTRLEENPEIKDLIVGELQAGATVPEACAEAGISKHQYYDWNRRGKDSDADSVFSKFSKETTHARRIASKNDRRELKSKCKENNDTRTWYKLHHDQYGDTYGKEEAEDRATGSEGFGVPDELIEQWQQEA
jgi:hypothetical protein